MSNYDFLRHEFQAFLNEEHPVAREEEDTWAGSGSFLQPVISSFRGVEMPIIHHEILRHFGCTIDEAGHHDFIRKIIDPIKQLEPSKISLLLEALNFYVGGIKEIRFRLEKTRHKKAVEWLFVDVHELGLSGLKLFMTHDEVFSGLLASPTQEVVSLVNDTIKDPVFLPFKQCYFCGKRPLKGKRGKAKRCHDEDCPTSNSDLSQHRNCCFRQWAVIKGALRRKLNASRTESDQRQVFRAFLESRYQENLDKRFDVYSVSDEGTFQAIRRISAMAEN